MNDAETNARIKEHEASYAVTRRGNPVFRYDTTSLASNSPIEDDSCCVILERDPSSNLQGDLVFWGTFDGHSGWQTSRLLSSNLVSYVARELDLVFRGSSQYADVLAKLPADTNLPPSAPAAKSNSSIWSLFSASPAVKLELDRYDPVIQHAIKKSFERMDSDIVNAPVKLLEKLEKEGKLAKPSIKEGALGVEQSEALQTLLPALSGSCALLALLDAGRNK